MIVRYKIIFAFLLASFLDDLCHGYSCPNGIFTVKTDKVEGCPRYLDVLTTPTDSTTKVKVIAGRTWIPEEKTGMEVISDPQYKIPELGCKGNCVDWFANTQTENRIGSYLFVSVMVNSGCILHVYQNYDFTGEYRNYTGPITIINPEKTGPIWNCLKTGVYKNMPCVGSMIWSCKQTIPDCKFTDKWNTVAVLDNTLASPSEVQFSYEKQIGTEFSHSIEQSKKVGKYVSLKLTAMFWEIAAAAKISKTTKYNWGQVDTETKSDMKTYNVNVKVPSKKKIEIQEVVGECVQADGGITTIHTQMFRVADVTAGSPGKVLRQYNGKITNYKISTKKGKWKG